MELFSITQLLFLLGLLMIINFTYLVLTRNNIEKQMARLYKIYTSEGVSEIHVIDHKLFNQSSFLIFSANGKKKVQMNYWGKVTEIV